MVFSISPALVFTVSFQSTLPVWGATFTSSRSFFKSKISIHAPRVGSDKFIIWYDGQKFNFNPRSPCGERPIHLNPRVPIR